MLITSLGTTRTLLQSAYLAVEFCCLVDTNILRYHRCFAALCRVECKLFCRACGAQILLWLSKLGLCLRFYFAVCAEEARSKTKKKRKPNNNKEGGKNDRSGKNKTKQNNNQELRIAERWEHMPRGQPPKCPTSQSLFPIVSMP